QIRSLCWMTERWRESAPTNSCWKAARPIRRFITPSLKKMRQKQALRIGGRHGKGKNGSFQTEGHLHQGAELYEALLVLSGAVSCAGGGDGCADAVSAQADGLCGG